MKFTVLGATGFIGRHVATHLRSRGHEVLTPARDAALVGQSLGHVICAIGLTGDFRERLFDTVDAHVAVVARLLPTIDYESFMYMSSTRVYRGLGAGARAHEESALSIVPCRDSVYDLSKMTGEALCLSQDKSSVRVVRLSNVVGPGMSPHTFLGAVVEEARLTGSVVIRDHPKSAKDYVLIENVSPLVEKVALEGQHRVYNVAAGRNISALEIASYLKDVGIHAVFSEISSTPRVFPRIDCSRIVKEFAFEASDLRSGLAALFAEAT